MTGEELNRKYWELKGWSIQRWGPKKNDYWDLINPEGEKVVHSWPLHLVWSQLPQLHLDANLAIAEADKHFRQVYELLRGVNGWTFRENVNARIFKDATPSLAILKALIAAGGK